MRDDQKIYAADGVTELKVNDLVEHEDDDRIITGFITNISDFDVDMNDETMRAEMDNPRITIRIVFTQTTMEFNTGLYGPANPYNEEHIKFICDELEKVIT